MTIGRLGLSALIDRLDDAGSAITRIRRGTTVWREALSDGREYITLRRKQLELIRAAAGSTLPCLIEGETGTGKELVARLLHEKSPRAFGPFVVVDCSSIPADLADVELFGATRGAYTGAQRERRGLVAQADGGTIFLDELHELPLALQAKLLRLLQEGTYRRVGEDAPRRVTIRCVAATNRPIDELLRQGTLRADLYHRLNGHRFVLSPLRARREEIRPLAVDILKRCGVGSIAPAVFSTLEQQDWPGNVRQLEMILRLAAHDCASGGRLVARHLAAHLRDDQSWSPSSHALRDGRSLGERELLARALRDGDGNVARAARVLGVSRQAIYKAMRRAGLSPDGALAPRIPSIVR